MGGTGKPTGLLPTVYTPGVSYGPDIWQWDEALGAAFAIGARDSARAGAEGSHDAAIARALAAAKPMLEEAATVIVAPAHPYVRLGDVESCLRAPLALPDLMPLTDRQRAVLDGTDPATSAYARASLARNAAQRAIEVRYAREREDAYAECREDDLEPPDLYAVRLLDDAQLQIAAAIPDASAATANDSVRVLHGAAAERHLLRLLAA